MSTGHGDGEWPPKASRTLLWTDLSPGQIATAMADLGTPVSPPVVCDWMVDQGR